MKNFKTLYEELNEAEIITSDSIETISKLKSLSDMKSAAVELIQASRTEAKKKASIINDIKKYTKADQITKTLWNMLLAGEKMGSIGSKYAKRMNEAVDHVTLSIKDHSGKKHLRVEKNGNLLLTNSHGILLALSNLMTLVVPFPGHERAASLLREAARKNFSADGKKLISALSKVTKIPEKEWKVEANLAEEYKMLGDGKTVSLSMTLDRPKMAELILSQIDEHKPQLRLVFKKKFSTTDIANDLGVSASEVKYNGLIDMGALNKYHEYFITNYI